MIHPQMMWREQPGGSVWLNMPQEHWRYHQTGGFGVLRECICHLELLLWALEEDPAAEHEDKVCTWGQRLCALKGLPPAQQSCRGLSCWSVVLFVCFLTSETERRAFTMSSIPNVPFYFYFESGLIKFLHKWPHWAPTQPSCLSLSECWDDRCTLPHAIERLE